MDQERSNVIELKQPERHVTPLDALNDLELAASAVLGIVWHSGNKDAWNLLARAIQIARKTIHSNT